MNRSGHKNATMKTHQRAEGLIEDQAESKDEGAFCAQKNSGLGEHEVVLHGR